MGKLILLALLIPLHLLAATNFIEKGSSNWNMLHIIDGVDPAAADPDFNTTWYHPTADGYVGGAYDGPGFTGGLPTPFHFGTVNGLTGGTALATPPSGSRYTSYFYKVFDAGNGAENIKISLLADDGAFVYLNGQLVARHNVTDPDTYTKLTSANGNESDYGNLAIIGNATLQPGLNLLAVSVHQTNTTSSDLGFDLELIGEFGLTLADENSSGWAILNTIDPATNDGFDPVTGHSTQAGDVDFNATWKNQTFGGYTGFAYDGPGFTAGQQAPFSYGGVDGIPSPNTVLTTPNSGTRHTEYFIKEIDGGVTGFDKATFTVLADDGAFIYLNGNLVGVIGNLPNDASQDTWSKFAGSVGSETTLHTLTVTGTGIIQPGINLLAVSVHQHSTTSSDLGFSLKLIGEEVGAPTIVRGPYLQSGSHDRMTLRWRTTEGSSSVVHYGDSPTNLTQTMSINDSVTDHIVTLTGLTAATQYYYQIESSNSSGAITQGAETDYYFKTSPTPGTQVPTRLWVIGDSGTRTSNQADVYNAYRTRTGTAHTDAWLMLGDNAYTSGTDSEFQGAVFDAYPELLRNTTMWSCIGNHETYTNGGDPYIDIHSFPTAGECGGVSSGSEHYYSYDHGNIHFVCLDTATSNVSDTPGSGGMIDWLELDLQATDKDWIIAYFHHGPYTKGSHDSDTESRHIEARRYMTPLLEDYGVDLVLSGHSHTYERSMLVNGHHSNMSADDSRSGTFDSNSHVIDGGNGSGLGSIDGNGNFINNGGDGAYLKDLGSVQSGTIYSVCGASGKISNWDNGSSLTVNPAPHPVFVVNLRTLGSMIINVDGTTLNAQYLDDNNVVRDDFTIVKQGPAPTNLPPVIVDAGFTLAENTSVSTFVGVVTGTDPDVSDVLTYSITGGNTGGAFSINSSTGEITTAAVINYETAAQYVLTVTVTDDGTPQEDGTATITMNVSDVNEAPSLTSSNGADGEETIAYHGSIAGTGMDPDVGDTLSYSKESGPSWLNVASNGSLIGTPANGDAGTNVWTIRVTDSGGLTADATLEITIIMANNPPLASDALFSLPENSSVGTVVGTVVAADTDSSDTLSFAITGESPAGAFSINSITGEITSASPLDFESAAQYLLTVTVTDDGSPTLSDTASITIDLLDINDAPSLANNTGGTGEADQPYSGSIGGTGSDPDAGDTLTYSKVAGASWLAIAPDGTLSGTPANEDVGANLWTVRVTDSSGLTADATLEITITANSPPIANDALFSLSENSSVGTIVGTVIANDTGDTLSFAITDESPAGAFFINPITGEITSASPLDFETAAQYLLTVTVTDDGSPALSDTASVTIDLLDINETPSLADSTGEAGEVDQPYGGSIGGTGSDPDAGDTLTYGTVSGPTWLTIALDGTLSGTPANEDIGANLWTVRVTDSSGLTADATLEITITANSLPIANDALFSLSENSSVGTVVGTVIANDTDAGDILSFTITGGNSAGAFSINSITGEITSASPLDFETATQYLLTVTVTDDGSPALSDSASITIDLLDINEAPSLADSTGGDGEVDQPYSGSIGDTGSDPDADDTLTYETVSGPTWLAIAPDGTLSGIPTNVDAGANLWTVRVTDSGGLTADATLDITVAANNPPVVSDALLSVSENSPAGTIVGIVIANDPGDTLSFAITGGNSAGAFSINSITGEITSVSPLDFENTSSFTLTVTVTDDGSPALNDAAVITVDVTNVNEVPIASDTAGSLAENSSGGAAVATVSASDPDAGDSLSYAITAGNDSNLFTIDVGGNVITTAGLDYESTSQHVLTVTVTDNGSLTDTATVTVDVTNVNEAPSADDTAGSHAENGSAGAAVATVSASDPDESDSLSYAITAGNGSGLFAIDTGGNVITTAGLDYESLSQHLLTVTVTDNGSLTDTAAVTVDVTNVNEAPSADDTAGSLAENGSGGDAVATVNASDPDADDSLSYAITAGNGSGLFAIDTGGNVITTAGLDYELASQHVLIVTVTDNGSLTDIANVTVNVTNVNEAPIASNTGGSVAEDGSIGTAVATVVATDVDTGNTLSYTITGGNTGGAFAIDSNGNITTATALDFEVTPSYPLTVTVTDDGTPQESDTATITINVSDVNEAPSLANSTGGDGEVDQPYSGSIGGSGSDPDADDTLSYSKFSGPTWLAIASDGALSGTPTDVDDGLNLWTVRVTDSGGLTANASLEITVADTPSGPTSVSASGETTSRGTLSGDLTSTTTSDNSYETLTEEVSGGNRRKQRSQLDHQWTFSNVPSGSSATLRVEAHHTANNEGDDFVFSYSTDGATFTNVLTVTKTSDNNLEQTALLPSNLSGTVFIRVTDTDNSQGNSVADSLYVDLLAIDVTPLSGPPLAAENPSPANSIEGTTLSPTLTWTASGGAESYQVFFGTSAPGIAQGSQTETSFDPGSLIAQTSYFWRVDSVNSNGTTIGTVWNFTTGSGTSGSLFSDDFEDGNLDGWSTTGSVSANSNAANSGVYGARLRKAAEMMITVDTTGLTSVNLKYDRTTTQFDTNETLEVEWSSDGSAWNLIETTSATSWGTTDVTLPDTAEGQSALRIRFKTNANRNNEHGYLDNVNVTGS